MAKSKGERCSKGSEALTHLGFQSESMRHRREAPIRLSPTPPALELSRNKTVDHVRRYSCLSAKETDNGSAEKICWRRWHILVFLRLVFVYNHWSWGFNQTFFIRTRLNVSRYNFASCRKLRECWEWMYSETPKYISPPCAACCLASR